MSLSLKQMRYAIAVAEAGHFGRAARLCNVSQPALSQQIQLIEEFCGTPLFDRLKTGVRPTPFGAEFVLRARQVLDSADALTALARSRASRPDRPIRFGLIPTVAPYLLPEIFPALTRGLPELEFTVSENRTEALVGGLVDGSLDLALIGTEPPDAGPRLTCEPLFKDAFVLATSQHEPSEGPISLAAVAPERILLLDEGHCFRDQTIAACRLDNDPGSRTFAATSLSTIVEFVANGQGVTLLPQIALRKEATDPRIAIHPLASPGAGRMLSLVWREATPFRATFSQIAQVIREARQPENAR
ncbi:hydrogen peroxide-inducible genes activator [Devosia sp. RR2S18]|uniref:hydrogen peroxide-inducible genes activator n=1 Tax=Devosia rhizosphaerae TaxID=3049774 RepID=UPI002540DC3A|nr:hydrogen peroxide-inducible genes activator [Devosia sp. RR2S18]WIJ26498.1 LysR substrate-binding domain-containing protein [Devosia sp. RR2S18]